MRVSNKNPSKIYNSIIVIFLITGILFFNKYGMAQTPEIKFINHKSVGGFVSTGLPIYTLDEGEKYHPIIIGGVLHMPLYQTKGRFNIAIDLMPQFGFVSYLNKSEYEIGFNVIFNFGFQIAKNSILSMSVGSGPHYITAIIERQASGFIFSDHLNFGYRHRLGRWQAGFSAGIRHVSNAGLKEPNQGIENIGIGVCLAKLF